MNTQATSQDDPTVERVQHPRGFLVSAVWTLGLLWLGSVVHATESSLACPDWPTCFGTMVPEMTGGVFWEHLHRLVAGGLILIFGGATYLVFKERPRFEWVRTVAVGGVFLLLIQAVLGGITVIYRLPDAVSTSHLSLAFLFLGLTAVLFLVTSGVWDRGVGPVAPYVSPIRFAAALATGLMFVQSVVGAAVRHTDAGVACPDVPLCLGEWIPPLQNGMVALHFGHRVLGIAALVLVLWVGHLAFWRSGSKWMGRLGMAAAGVALGQVLLGFLSVYFRLAVVPVSLHTLLAAVLLTLTTAILTFTWAPEPAAPGGARLEASPDRAAAETVGIQAGSSGNVPNPEGAGR